MDPSAKHLRVSVSSRWLLVGLVLCCGLVWVCINLWTVPAGIAWHVQHGSSVQLDGRAVRVPWTMWVYQPNTENLTIEREAPKYPFFKAASGTMLIGRSPNDTETNMATDYDRISHADQRPLSGYVFVGVHQLAAAKGPGYCWESASVDLSQVSIDCRFDHDTLDAAYQGSQMYREDFYQAAATASGASPQSVP